MHLGVVLVEKASMEVKVENYLRTTYLGTYLRDEGKGLGRGSEGSRGAKRGQERHTIGQPTTA